MNSTGWHFTVVGIPWWLVLPLALGAAWAIARIIRGELAPLPAASARVIRILRIATVLTVVVLLIEPTLTHVAMRSERPAVAVVIDRTGSMAVTDAQLSLTRRLDEAEALGLVQPRAAIARDAHRALAALMADLPRLGAAIAATREAWSRGQPWNGREEAAALATAHGARCSTLIGKAGEADAALKEAVALMERCAALVRRERAADGEADGLAKALDRCAETARTVLPRLATAQETADGKLLAGDGGRTLKPALDALAQRSRFDRARTLAVDRLKPLLDGRGAVEFFALDEGAENGLAPLDVKAAQTLPAGGTDFATPFAALARSWAEKQPVGAVVLLSDGRQTAGGDPVPALRALAARGARLAAVVIGDPGQARDAVVAEVAAPAEVFRGETIRLDVRYRITGYGDQPWNLVVTCDGAPVATREVRGDGSWQMARIDLPDAAPGVHTYQARLERPAGADTLAGHGLVHEEWTGVGGGTIADLTAGNRLDRRPDATRTVPGAEIPLTTNRFDLGARLRGWVVPPQTGEYVFWVVSDDSSELWLSPNEDPKARVRIASLDGWARPDEWEKLPTQRSRPVALEQGRRYAIEILYKQGGADSHLTVGWQLPDGTRERPISPRHLTPVAGAARHDDQAEASAANNAADCSVTVNDDPLKVLVVDNAPRWEGRYLVDLFERDRRVEVVRRYRSVRVARGEKELMPATQQAVDAFDVIVVGDLAPGELTADDQVRLERFTARRGGFVVCLAGPRGMPAGYGMGGLSSILPVRVTGGTPGQSPPTRVALAPGAERNPLVAVLDDAGLNKRLWPLLPPLTWIARGVAAKPGAEVLLESGDGAHVPVVACQRYGAGRVLWVGTGETWRWRDRVGDRVHQGFWLQAVRWGLGLRLRGADARLHMAIDRSLATPREPVELRVRLRTADGSAAAGPAKARLELLDDQGKASAVRELELTRVEDSDGQWHTTLRDLEPGRWRITALSDDPALAGKGEARDLLVRARPSVEGIELGADAAAMARLADAGGFRSATMAQAAELVTDLAAKLEPRQTPVRRTHSLWDLLGATIILSLVSLLLLAEWLLRKRAGLP